ncbi:hypothetical protein [Aliidiomarina quisquiliarum]|uniref:hypothetical protein n=1 Tax=Aliidiomarina quisquiliarum TaxID=2938947 RepID=UPI00208FCBE3|nr:hypothetical protein [Aliidiomarina quisquiliarum]MCO4319981.1 hypothetical protein [Aliidiomarina quisquiliarum]
MFYLHDPSKERFKRDIKLEPHFKPKLKFAIGFFDTGIGFASTIHSVENGALGIGKPVSCGEVISALNNIMQEEAEQGLLRERTGKDRVGWTDKRVIFENASIVAWVAPATKRAMWFRIGSDRRIKLNPYWPRLLFIAHKSSMQLRVYCVARANVTPDTLIYHAPICNVNAQGVICQGSATRPEYKGITTSAFLDECEAVIYDSNFTHVNHNQTFNHKGRNGVTTEAHIAHWKRIEKAQRKTTTKDLVRTSWRASDVLLGAAQ